MTDELDSRPPEPLGERAADLLGAYRRHDALPPWVQTRVHERVTATRDRVTSRFGWRWWGPLIGGAVGTAVLVIIVSQWRSAASERDVVANVAASLQRDGGASAEATHRSGGSAQGEAELDDSGPPQSGGGANEGLPTDVANDGGSETSLRSSPRRPLAETRPRSRSESTPRRSASMHSSSIGPADAASGQLLREQRALDGVRQALAGDDLDAAAAGVAKFYATFAAPRLAVEAAALAAIVDCRRDPARARQFLTAFERAHPQSLLTLQVHAACSP